MISYNTSPIRNLAMISNSWSVKLSEEPLLSTVCNIPEPGIVYQGVSNQLIVYTKNESIPLPIRKEVISLSSVPHTNQVLILTKYDLTCFDLINNDEVFTKEFQNAQKLFVSSAYIYVVCGSDLFCFTHSGEEEYVNHLSVNITTIEPFSNLQKEEVIIAGDDMSMLRYKGLNITYDYGKVVGVVCSACWIENGVLVGTQEGPVAYYETKKSKWKAKSTHSVAQIVDLKKPLPSTDLQDQKFAHHTFVIRKNGNIELRDWKKGETISKVKVGEPTINVHIYDFRKEGHEQIICVCKSSIVKAYNLEQEVIEQKNKVGDEISDEVKKIDVLLKEKANLEYEIQQLQEELNRDEDDNSAVESQAPLSKDFKIEASLDYRKGLELNIKCQNGFISGLSFEQPILPIKTDRTQKLCYLFQNENKIAGDIDCEALVHSSFSTKSYEIKTFKIHLPKFWHWGHSTQKSEEIKNFVIFDLIERNARYLKWAQECFFINLTAEQVSKLESQPVLMLRFQNFYENSSLELVFKSKEGKVQIYCDSLITLGSIVQDLMEYTGTKQLESKLSFPEEKEKLKELLETIEKLSQTKISINSEMAEVINNIKFLLVKGESSLAVGNFAGLRKSYGDVMGQNKNILLEIEKKSSNTASLSEKLKQLGKLINVTSNVRFGKPKEQLIAQCRQAIKNKDFPKIISLMERGATPQ